jgi:adenine-specific DNA-methyltransferase
MITPNAFLFMDCKPGMKEIAPESVDCVFTDPPYVSDLWENAFTVLARGAMRVLKPGGWCVTYQPQRHLLDIGDIMRRPGLQYYWDVPVLNLGQSTAMVHDRNVICLHKPIFIYQKPLETLKLRTPPLVFTDVIRGLRQKAYHAWQQDIHDPISLLSRICHKGDLILDPYAGTATTLIAAKVMGMRYIGFEIDYLTWRMGKDRLTQQPITLENF